ncbi:alpha/beta hydrolase [Flavihumibacter sp. RY-1]|uniref:Alpha/beta hydrolase n=1 Tax=Flavihumibacter fluminis TaxID=2909236 RepID=A0ABS9BIU6_9BACT|nr:alpha/beta hydrolase [Flavihumibacter fluminis]MCF1715038.1 alpha/beta hydrolase [Flavihumibacter fluminis]
MSRSLSYYLVLGMLKIKGIKKQFSENPINYRQIREKDVYRPTNGLLRKFNTTTFKIDESSITVIRKTSRPERLLLYVHGGAFVAGPGQHHWDFLETLTNAANVCSWLCNYPKAPEHRINLISENLDEVYSFALSHYAAENIVLMGDSVGGTLIIALVQRLIKNQQPLPSKLILLSPVLDASFSNPAIAAIEPLDPMLSVAGAKSAKQLCAIAGDLRDPRISPLYGSCKGFPETHLFAGELDITYPDQQVFAERLQEANVNFSLVIGKGMPHIWPLLPVMKEAKQARNQLIALLNANSG